MLRYLFYAFLIYLTYRVVFHFIIPIYKTTRQVKKQFREMHSRMEEQINQQSSFAKASEDKQANQQTAGPQPENKKEVSGDYIDFEEVK